MSFIPVTKVQRTHTDTVHIQRGWGDPELMIYFQIFNICSPIILIPCTVVNINAHNGSKYIVSLEAQLPMGHLIHTPSKGPRTTEKEGPER